MSSWTTFVVGGVNLYQTELSGRETPPWFGSPASAVAETVVPATELKPAPMSVA